MTKPTKTYVRTYDVGRVVAWLKKRNITLPQIADTCGLKTSYLSFVLRKYRTHDMTSRTDENKAKRLYALMEKPIERRGRAYATDAEMQEFRKCVSTLRDAGMTLTHIARETGLTSSTIVRGMSETLTRASVAKLLSVRSDLAFDAQNGFGKNRSQNVYTIKKRAESCRNAVNIRHDADATVVREWLAAHPGASRTACAHALGWSAQRVINIDDKHHIFDERSKKRPIDDKMIERYESLQRRDPKRSAKSIAEELGISQKSATRIRKILKERKATDGDTDL